MKLGDEEGETLRGCRSLKRAKVWGVWDAHRNRALHGVVVVLGKMPQLQAVLPATGFVCFCWDAQGSPGLLEVKVLPFNVCSSHRGRQEALYLHS